MQCFLIMYIISGDVVPVPVPEPVPAVQIGCPGVRAVPEVPACTVSPYEGRTPLPCGDSPPPQAANRRRRSTSTRSRARTSSSDRQPRRSSRSRGSRPASILVFPRSRLIHLRSIGLHTPAMIHLLPLMDTRIQLYHQIRSLQSTSPRCFPLPPRV